MHWPHKIVFWFPGKLLLMPTLTWADLAYCQQCIGHMATRHKQWWYIYNDIIRSLTFNYWLDVFWSDACISLHNTLAMPIIRGCSMVELHLKLLKISFIFFSQSLDMTSSWYKNFNFNLPFLATLESGCDTKLYWSKICDTLIVSMAVHSCHQPAAGALQLLLTSGNNNN